MKNNEFSNFNFDNNWKIPSNSITNLIEKITTLPNFKHQNNNINTNCNNNSINSKNNSYSENKEQRSESENDIDMMLNIILKNKVENNMVKDYLEQFKDKIVKEEKAEISEFPHKKPSKLLINYSLFL